MKTSPNEIPSGWQNCVKCLTFNYREDDQYKLFISASLQCCVRNVTIWLFALCITGLLLTMPVSATELVSVNAAGTDGGNDQSHIGVISADGRFVAFTSLADNLVDTDSNHTRDVFVRDHQTGVTKLVSVNAAGTDSGNDGSNLRDISADGRFVAFDSFASDLVDTDTDHTGDVFVRDMQTGITKLVSINAAGTDSGNAYSWNPKISADGRFVAFESFANDLVDTNDANNGFDVFVRDLQTDITILVSINTTGTSSGKDLSAGAEISANGRFVAFHSRANDLVDFIDTNNRTDVFVRDLQTGVTELVSVNDAGTDSGNNISLSKVISANGRSVAFVSLATDLVAIDDTNNKEDVYVRDLHMGITELVNVNAAGDDSGNGRSLNPKMSADGQLVTFQSRASDLIDTDTDNEEDVFVRNLQRGITELVSVNAAETSSGNGLSVNPEISANGRFVAFHSFASDLVDTDTNNNTQDVFVRNLQTGFTELVSINIEGTGSGNDRSFNPKISANGRLIAFSSFANDLEETDSNDQIDVFIRKITSSPEDAIKDLIEEIYLLIEEGILNKGQGNSLIVKLDNVLKKLDQGKTKAACNNLNAFINHVQGFVRGGRLSAAQGQALIDEANNIRADLDCKIKRVYPVKKFKKKFAKQSKRNSRSNIVEPIF